MLSGFEDDMYIDQEVEDYINFLNDDDREQNGFLTHKRVNENFEKVGKMLNEFIVYPDRFIDLIIPHDSKFHLFFFQRLMLRCMARNNQTYAVFSRGTSKSFLADLDRYLHCMFIPRHNTTIVAGTKTQAAQIAKQKIVDDLWVKFPLLSNEMQKRRVAGKLLDPYVMGKDYVEFKFKNGSSMGLGNVRGLRRESLILEEVIEQDPITVNETYLPLLNKPRANAQGLINPHEPQSQQIYVTTAGYQGTYAYDKCVETMCRSILEPDKYIVLHGSFRIPLSCHLTSPSMIEDVRSSPSFSKDSFEREYESVWSSAPKGAAFSANTISTLRKIKKIELKNNIPYGSDDFYVMCADMAKDGSARTAAIIARVHPDEHFFRYKFVNLFTIDSTDYMVIANEFKKKIMQYDIKLFIYDANGVGAGLRDWLNKETVDEQGFKLCGYGIINPPSSAEKDTIKYPKDLTICYEIKSGGEKGEQIHHFFFSRMSTGAITFPVKFAYAITLFEQNKTFFKLSPAKQKEQLLPYKMMDRMEEELKNLDIVNTSDQLTNRLKIVRRNTAIQKDFFSAGEYLVYGVNQFIEMDYYKKRKTKTSSRISAFIFE